MIKGVKLSIKSNEKGYFFGMLDEVRGLVEAILAIIAFSIFAYTIDVETLGNTIALKRVIYMYSYFCIAIGVLVFLFLKNDSAKDNNQQKTLKKGNLARDLRILLLIPDVWTVAAILFCGYQLFWGTYSFFAIIQEKYQITAVTAGIIPLITYTSDIFLPQIYSLIAAHYKGITAYTLYFGYLSLVGVLGALAVLKLRSMTKRKKGKT